MVYKCCVPNCRGNYKGGPKVHVFKFPTDAERRRRWLSSIPREDLVVTENTRVCHVHFHPSDIIWESGCFDENTGKWVTAPLMLPKLRETAIPQFFPDCPSYLSRNDAPLRESPAEKRQRREAATLRQALEDSLKVKTEYEEKFCFSDFETFKKCNQQNQLDPFWDYVEKEKCVLFLHFKLEESPKVMWCLQVSDELQVTVYYKGVRINKINGATFPLQLGEDIHIFYNLLDAVKHTDDEFGTCDINNLCQVITDTISVLRNYVPDEDNNFLQFVHCQFDLLQKGKRQYKYDHYMMIFSTLLYLISPCAYKFIRHTGNIILPHPSTVRKMCGKQHVSPHFEQNDAGFLQYVRTKVSSLQAYELPVTLMIDEIHLKAFMEYKGGSIVGAASNNNLAHSAHVFMIQSLLSPYKDVAHVFPVHSLTAKVLHDLIKKVILGLEGIGFKVIAVVTDNNAINRKAVSAFADPPALNHAYPHPVDRERPLFFVVDTVHLLKCIRNNWLNQKNPGHCLAFPCFNGDTDAELIEASFETLRKIYKLESEKLVKYGYGLSMKALWPSSMERQNVKLALQVFNKFVIESLNKLGPQHDIEKFHGTAEFIGIICAWWSVVNVKTPWKGKRVKDIMQEPLTNDPDDPRLQFLNQFLCWLEKWGQLHLSSGVFSRETHEALIISTQALLELADYCITELNLRYILPGKFQTDALEDRFGKYRQLAGSNYSISLRHKGVPKF